MAVKAKKKSAGARIKESGKSLVWATFNAIEKDKIRVASAMSAVPMSEFLRIHGLSAAEKILAKSSK